MIPKGKLIPVGGNEVRREIRERTAEGRAGVQTRMEILHRILTESKGEKTNIVIIPTASSIPQEIANDYVLAYKSLGVAKIDVLPIRLRNQTDKPAHIEQVKKADVVMFTGGDQRKLTVAFADTTFLATLKERYEKESDFVIAGTSAGAMAMSQVMIAGGDTLEAMFKSTTHTYEGLGFIGNAIIDSHFVIRGRFGRLAVAVAKYPNTIGVGLGEDTGVVITEGRYMEAIGSRLVTIFDAKEMGHSNLQVDKKGMVALENINMHVFPRGYIFDLSSRRLTHIPEEQLYKEPIEVS